MTFAEEMAKAADAACAKYAHNTLFYAGAHAALSSELVTNLAELIRHAIELEYFSEGGSTERWAQDALSAYESATKAQRGE